MRSDVNKHLLFLYWSGLATPMQRQLIGDWLAQPGHQELFYIWLVEWEEQHPQSKPDAEQAWAELSAKMSLPLPASAPPAEGTKSTSWHSGSLGQVWWLAASLLLAAGLGWLFRNQFVYTTYQTGYAQVLPVTLPDGSTATLNANSRLQLLRPWLGRFMDRERLVWLQGEANFKITHQPNNQPFVVRTDNPLDVVVLGTEFAVTARPLRFRVALHTGKVILRAYNGRAQHPLALRPGDVFSQTRQQKARLQHRQPTQRLVTWQDHEFIFDHTSLPDVLTMVDEQFGVSVQLAHDSLAKAQITGRFRAREADELLLAITTVTGYRLVEQNGIKTIIP